MSDLTLRRYEPGDAEAVWDLHERALRAAGAYHEEFAYRDADVRNVEEEYLEPGGEFVVGERDGEVVAMGALQPASEVAYHDGGAATAVVRRMRVEPTLQRRGYGTQVLAYLEERAADLGFERLVLDATDEQAAAMAFYERHGYEETDRESIPVGEMVFYEKVLV